MKPVAVSDIDLAFPASVTKLMPPFAAIPQEFKDGRTRWNEFFNDAFYGGVKKLDLKPKDGIDAKTALRHVRCVMGSFEPKHDHKEAACAYLMSLWFDDATTWERAK